MRNEDDHVYCTTCKHFRVSDDAEEIYCEYSKECCLLDPEDSMPLSERPMYEEQNEPELGHILFGNFSGEFPVVPREKMEEYFFELLEAAQCDDYGYASEEAKTIDGIICNEANGGIDTELFSINPYYWGDDDAVAKLPNFRYKPEDLEIFWYKYPLRDAWSNREISTEKMKKICEECIEFIGKL